MILDWIILDEPVDELVDELVKFTGSGSRSIGCASVVNP
jgi:hypothetical protein